MMARKVTLSGGGPWGFTLTGGKDFGSHLQVSKVTIPYCPLPSSTVIIITRNAMYYKVLPVEKIIIIMVNN